MTHKHRETFYPVPSTKSKHWHEIHSHTVKGSSPKSAKPKLDMVLKCDSAGSIEAVKAAVLKMSLPEAVINIIHSGVGDIHKSDILIAETGSRLIAGFQVNVPAGVDGELKEHNVEARLYSVIYNLTDDIKSVAESMIPRPAEEETILGNAKIIALFKSSRKGIIIGCEALDGHLSVGQRFRIISAMGPVYSGIIESMHIENNIVQKATPGQQVGIKISDFNQARIGDLVESYRPSASKKAPVWQPTGGVIRK